MGLVELESVFKSVEGNSILKDINLKLEKGSVLGLIGPNGAGKTSLIKLVTGIWEPDAGTVTVDGSNVYSDTKVRKSIGYVPDQCHYYESFKVSDMQIFYGLTYESFDYDMFKRLCESLQISPDKKIRQLSKGMKTKLALIFALSIRPELMVLDEPTSGLDPIAKRKFMELLLDEVAERKTTLLISTHNLYDVEQFCDTIAVLNNGQITYSGSIDNMKKQLKKLQVVFDGQVPQGLTSRNDIIGISNVGSVFYIVTNSGGDLETWLQAKRVKLMETVDMSLEDIFIQTLGGENVYDQVNG